VGDGDDGMGIDVDDRVDEAVLGALEQMPSMSSEGLCELVRKLAPHVARQGHPGVDVVMLAAIDRLYSILYSIWDVGEAEGGCLEPVDVVAALASSAYSEVTEVLGARIATASVADDETDRAENAYLVPEGRWRTFQDVLDMQMKAGAGKRQRKRSSVGQLVSPEMKSAIRAAKRERGESLRQGREEAPPAVVPPPLQQAVQQPRPTNTSQRLKLLPDRW
jgi:hypothetical protein